MICVVHLSILPHFYSVIYFHQYGFRDAYTLSYNLVPHYLKLFQSEALSVVIYISLTSHHFLSTSFVSNNRRCAKLIKGIPEPALALAIFTRRPDFLYWRMLLKATIRETVGHYKPDPKKQMVRVVFYM
jgi:hypothetical protein